MLVVQCEVIQPSCQSTHLFKDKFYGLNLHWYCYIVQEIALLFCCNNDNFIRVCTCVFFTNPTCSSLQGCGHVTNRMLSANVGIESTSESKFRLILLAMLSWTRISYIYPADQSKMMWLSGNCSSVATKRCACSCDAAFVMSAWRNSSHCGRDIRISLRIWIGRRGQTVLFSRSPDLNPINCSFG